MTEVALAAVLAVAAGLMGRSFYRLVTVDPGFTPERALSFRVDLSAGNYSEPERRGAFYDRFFDRLQNTPGIEAVGANSRLPIAQRGSYQLLEIEAMPDPAGAPRTVYWRSVAGDYFTTLGIPLLAGRELSSADRQESQPVCLINQTMAQRFWNDSSPIGHRIQNSMDGDTWVTIVGVVGDVKHNGLDQASELMMYRPFSQSPPWISNLSVVVRSALPSTQLAGTIRNAAAEVDTAVPVFRVQSLEQVVADSVSQERLTTALLTLFGVVSLALAALGVFGVLAFSVSQRAGEIGIRRALGARGQDILQMILKEGMALTVAGLALGLVGALSLTRFLSGLLFGVSATDPATYLIVTFVILLVAFAACYLPSRRASRVDPMVVLRYE